MNSDLARLYRASAHDLPMVESESVQTICTSPPYFGLRKYDGEQDIEWGEVTYSPMAGLPPITVPAMTCPLGNESTIESYIAHLILCAREWRRVLADTGTVFVNLGDSYANDSKWGGASGGIHPKELHGNTGIGRAKVTTGLPPKSLMMIPARFALAMQADGWILRSEIVWAKPNPMPESVTDRPTKAHEMIYLFSKRERYFWDADAVREPLSEATLERDKYGRPRNQFQAFATGVYHSNEDMPSHFDTMKPNPKGRNLRSVLTVATAPLKAAHFAAFPPALVEPMIKAGTSGRGCCPTCGTPWRRVVETPKYPKELRAKPGDEGVKIGYQSENANTMGAGQAYQDWRNANPPVTVGWEPGCDCPAHEPVPCVVMDPFSGSGTTGRVAIKLGRRYIGIDLSEAYLTDLAPERLTVQMDLLPI